jgi:hypothetical protein
MTISVTEWLLIATILTAGAVVAMCGYRIVESGARFSLAFGVTPLANRRSMPGFETAICIICAAGLVLLPWLALHAPYAIIIFCFVLAPFLLSDLDPLNSEAEKLNRTYLGWFLAFAFVLSAAGAMMMALHHPPLDQNGKPIDLDVVEKTFVGWTLAFIAMRSKYLPVSIQASSRSDEAVKERRGGRDAGFAGGVAWVLAVFAVWFICSNLPSGAVAVELAQALLIWTLIGVVFIGLHCLISRAAPSMTEVESQVLQLKFGPETGCRLLLTMILVLGSVVGLSWTPATSIGSEGFYGSIGLVALILPLSTAISTCDQTKQVSKSGDIDYLIGITLCIILWAAALVLLAAFRNLLLSSLLSVLSGVWLPAVLDPRALARRVFGNSATHESPTAWGRTPH